MTREEWDAICTRRISTVMRQGWDSSRAIHWANESTTKDYGPRPEKPKKVESSQQQLSWPIRTALRLVVPNKETRNMVNRILVAVMYAIGVGVAAYQATGLPQTPEAWIGFVLAIFVAFWGKFSSSTTVISATRPGETQGTKPGVTL